jgi:hypothetical protein
VKLAKKKKLKGGASRLNFIGTRSVQSIFDYNKLSKYRPISNLGKFVMQLDLIFKLSPKVLE